MIEPNIDMLYRFLFVHLIIHIVTFVYDVIRRKITHKIMNKKYYWDFEQITDDKEDKFPIINWQQVRVDAAIAAMPLVYNLMDGVCCTQPKYPNQTSRAETFAKECVGFADALIKELKK